MLTDLSCDSVSTLLALLLDIHTHRADAARGAYNAPEDDKELQRLNDMKSMRVKSEGYEAPKDQKAVSSAVFDDGDIGYHNRYGVEEGHEIGWAVGYSPVDESNAPRDMGYHNRFFHD